MSKVRDDQPVLPSVLDRLIDDDVTTQRELPKLRNQVLRELKQSVRRDLENLLNTRWRCVAWPPNLAELDLSLVNYGIPDFTGANMATAESREQLRQIVERVLQQFEPRFKSVRVQLLQNREREDRMFALPHRRPALRGTGPGARRV